MAAEPAREWSDEQLKSDDLPKKDIIKFIQDNAAHSVRSSPSFPLASCSILELIKLNYLPEMLLAARLAEGSVTGMWRGLRIWLQLLDQYAV